MIASVRSARHKAQQKGNKKMIDETLAKEARLQKDLVKAEWQERKVAAMQAERDLKAHRKELGRQERDLRWGPTLNVLKGVGKAVGSGVKKGARAAREHAQRANARIDAYNERGAPRITGLDRVLDSAGAEMRKMERHDAAAQRAAAKQRKPDPYHRTGAVHAGHFDVSNMDSRTIEKVRRARGV